MDNNTKLPSILFYKNDNNEIGLDISYNDENINSCAELIANIVHCHYNECIINSLSTDERLCALVFEIIAQRKLKTYIDSIHSNPVVSPIELWQRLSSQENESDNNLEQ